MNTFKIAAVLITSLFIFISCDTDTDEQEDMEEAGYSIPVEGRLTVDPELDDTGDYSGINVRILNIFEPETDTLYHAVTDSSGYFSGYADFMERGEYLMEIRRGGNEIASANLILAQNDTIRIESELPDFDEQTQITSREFEANNEYQRLMNQFTRVSTYINAGLIDEEESLENLYTWNELFWDMSQNYEGTLAADRALIQAVGILQDWDNEKMFEQLGAHPDNEALIEAGLYHGVPVRITEGGLDAGLEYMDTLRERSQHSGNRQLVGIHRIEMLYDSSRVDQAKEHLSEFREEFGNDPGVQDWITSIAYDLENLAPGMEVPDFTISLLQGDQVTKEDLAGRPFIIEFVNFEDPNYQFSFPVLRDIYDQYREDELQILTIPTHENTSTVQGFVDDNDLPWYMADAGVYSDENLIESFNVDQIPVRVLVNAEGRIVRKYYEAGVQELELDLSQQRHQTDIL